MTVLWEDIYCKNLQRIQGTQRGGCLSARLGDNTGLEILDDVLDKFKQ